MAKKIIWIIIVLLLCSVLGGCAYVRDQDAIYSLYDSRSKISLLESEAQRKDDQILSLKAENATLRALANQEFNIKLDPIEISAIPIQLTIKFPDGTEQAIPISSVDADYKSQAEKTISEFNKAGKEARESAGRLEKMSWDEKKDKDKPEKKSGK